MVRVSYLGPAGTFTEAALLQLSAAGLVPGAGRHDVRPVSSESTPAALDAVRFGAADYACVAIENSIEGGVSPTLDSLATGAPLQIFAETILDVMFSIVVTPGRTAADVQTVAAHPVAAAQVRRWLAAHLPGTQLVPANSNAAAAHQVVDGAADAGVSTALAAERLKLASLADGVVDEQNARTRFVLVGQPADPPARSGADRTSVVLWMDNRPGALAAALTEFGTRGIDLTRIESRPTRTGLGSYLFFLDCTGHRADPAVDEVLGVLRQRCTDVRYLGSWPAARSDDGAPR